MYCRLSDDSGRGSRALEANNCKGKRWSRFIPPIYVYPLLMNFKFRFPEVFYADLKRLVSESKCHNTIYQVKQVYE